MTERLKRINELAHKEKSVGLTDEEKAEQAKLRAEYIAAFRANFRAELDNTYIQYEDGTRKKLKPKDE